MLGRADRPCLRVTRARRRLFNKFEVLNGGIESGFNKVAPETYRPRLLHVKGTKRIIIREVPMQRESLNRHEGKCARRARPWECQPC